MSSIMLTSVPVHGHVTPLLPIAEGFVRRGDDVRFLTGSRFADKVRATGATFIPLPEEADFDDRTHLEDFPERAGLRGSRAVAFDIDHIFARPAKAQYEAIIAAARQPIDVVITDPTFGGAVFLLAHPRAQRPAVVMCGVVPLGVRSRDTAPFGMGLPPARMFNRQRNAVLEALSRRVLRDATRTTNALHRQVHGTDLRFDLMDWSRHVDAMVQLSVAAFEYPRSDAPPNLHFAGPVTAGGASSPLPDWWSDLDGTRPVVHVTQGTVANTDYRQTIAPTLAALAGDDDLLVVVATGGRPVDTLPPLPANARAATYLPYDELLPRTAVYVTNGGYGGVQYALRHGVPIVATGGKEDKPEVGARVAWSGVGRRIRAEHPSPRAIRRAVNDVLSDPRYRAASRRIADEIASGPGFSMVADIADRLTQTPCPPTAKSPNPDTVCP